MPRWVVQEKGMIHFPTLPFRVPLKVFCFVTTKFSEFSQRISLWPVSSVLWRPLWPRQRLSLGSGFLQHRRLLRGWGWGAVVEEGGTGLGGSERLRLDSSLSFSPIHWHVFSSSKFCKIRRSPPENGGRCREAGRCWNGLGTPVAVLIGRAGQWLTGGLHGLRLQSAHPSSGAG